MCKESLVCTPLTEHMVSKGQHEAHSVASTTPISNLTFPTDKAECHGKHSTVFEIHSNLCYEASALTIVPPGFIS